MLSHCWRLRVTAALSPALPLQGGAGAGTPQALLPRTSSGGLVTLGDSEVPLRVHEAPMEPWGQHRGLGDAAPGGGEQDPGPTGRRPVVWCFLGQPRGQQPPNPTSLSTVPHPLCTGLSVSGQTVPQQNTDPERAPPTSRSKTASRGKSEKQTPPSEPGETTPIPFHRQTGQGLALGLGSSPGPGHPSGCQVCLNATSPRHRRIPHLDAVSPGSRP